MRTPFVSLLDGVCRRCLSASVFLPCVTLPRRTYEWPYALPSKPSNSDQTLFHPFWRPLKSSLWILHVGPRDGHSFTSALYHHSTFRPTMLGISRRCKGGGSIIVWHTISILQAFTWQLGFGGSFAVPFLLTPLPNLLKP